MKKQITTTFTLLFVSLTSVAQALHIFHDRKAEPDVIANLGIDSIYYEPKYADSTEYLQVFVTKDGVKRYDQIDSVKFNLPHLVAYRHSYTLPSNESLCVGVYASSSEEDEPLLNGRATNNYNGRYNSHPNYGCEWDLYPYSNDTVPSTTMMYLTCGEMKDSITLNFTGKRYANNPFYNGMVLPPDETDYIVDANLPFRITPTNMFYNSSETAVEGDIGKFTSYMKDGKPVIHLDKNETEHKLAFGYFIQGDGYSNSNSDGRCLFQYKPFVHTADEHMAALREFCDSTNFAVWGEGSNWWSNQPLWEWDFSVNSTGYSKYIINDHVLGFDLSENHLVHGQIPASFQVFLDDMEEFEYYNLYNNSGRLYPLFHRCGLCGIIPENIRHHKLWPKYGWNIVWQNTFRGVNYKGIWLPGGGFDVQDFNLRIDSTTVNDIVNHTVSNTYDMLRKNKLTWVYRSGDMTFRFEGIPDEYVNKYLDYCDKGLGFIAVTGSDTINASNWAIKQQTINHLPKSITFVDAKGDGGFTNGKRNTNAGATGYGIGNMSLLDSEGNLLFCAETDFGMPRSYYTSFIDKACRQYLGEPTVHDTYVSTPYESKDFSLDGQVVTLQKSTVGKGIDLVFLGDRYVDTLLVDGGVYERDMRDAMEHFFAIEPYKTLRNRFNVYTVKAVSVNGDDGNVHKFHGSNDIVIEYVNKIPNIDIEHATIAVLNYESLNNAFIVENTCNLYNLDATPAIAYINSGEIDISIPHEVGGHLFAKLIDEFVYSGYENNHTQESEEFKRWIQTNYHDKGMGINISTTDNPEEVPWSRMLNDELYKNELGIYKGAWQWPEELWRPSENSVMKDRRTLWFNAPSREAIYKRVMKLSEGDDWAYNYEKFVEFDAPIRESYQESLKSNNIPDNPHGAAPSFSQTYRKASTSVGQSDGNKRYFIYKGEKFIVQ